MNSVQVVVVSKGFGGGCSKNCNQEVVSFGYSKNS